MMNRIGMIIILAILLSACGMTTTTPAIEVYTLSPVDKHNHSYTVPESLSIQLAAINSSQAFQSNKIIYRDEHQRFNSYAYNRWSDSSTHLLARYFQQFLQQSNVFSAVIAADSISHVDWLLESNLYDFSHYITGPTDSHVQVTLQYYLVDRQTKQILATTRLSSRVVVERQNAQAAVRAFNQAAEIISKQLLSWLQQQYTNNASKNN